MISFPLLIANILGLIWNLTEYIENKSQIHLIFGAFNFMACLIIVRGIYEE